MPVFSFTIALMFAVFSSVTVPRSSVATATRVLPSSRTIAFAYRGS